MTIISDPDRPMDLPRIKPDLPPCPAWCDHAHAGVHESLTYLTFVCTSEDLFIPYAAGGRIMIDREEREPGNYPPVIPAFLKTYLWKSFGHEPTVQLSASDENELTLTISEAHDLREALGRLLDQAGAFK